MFKKKFMQEALLEAEKAYVLGEAPIGAIIVYGDEIIARTHNEREVRQDPTAHAEILAIRLAAKKIKSWRLTGTTIYVTLEPCAMCAGALVQARVATLVFGAPDNKAGAAGSLMNITDYSLFNHRLQVYGGIMEEECKQLLQRFFQEKR